MSNNTPTSIFLNKYVQFRHYSKRAFKFYMDGYVYKVSPHIVYVKVLNKSICYSSVIFGDQDKLTDENKYLYFKFKRRVSLRRLSIVYPSCVSSEFENKFKIGTRIINRGEQMLNHSKHRERFCVDNSFVYKISLEPQFDFCFDVTTYVIKFHDEFCTYFEDGKYMIREGIKNYYIPYELHNSLFRPAVNKKIGFVDVLPFVKIFGKKDDYYLLESDIDCGVLCAKFDKDTNEVSFVKFDQSDCYPVEKSRDFYENNDELTIQKAISKLKKEMTW